jgi:hypothetical protein
VVLVSSVRKGATLLQQRNDLVDDVVEAAGTRM